MTIRYQCIECDATMKIKDEKAGTTAHCPKCKVEFVVPAVIGDESAEPVAPAPKATVAKTEAEIEDELQAILMGDGPTKNATARRKTADSDTYLTSDTDDPPTKTDFARSDTGFASATAPATPQPRARSTAEISASLMKNSTEPTLKRTGKAFGEGSGDKVSAQARAAAQARVYYAKQIGFGSLIVFVVCYGMYSLMSSMMGGPKLPPLARVSGTVTLDGKPLPGASVLFQPIVEGPKVSTRVAASIGITDKLGHFDLQYVQGVYGAALGKHSIQVRATNDAGLEIVPARYNYNSELGFEVTKSSKPADFALSSK